MGLVICPPIYFKNLQFKLPNIQIEFLKKQLNPIMRYSSLLVYSFVGNEPGQKLIPGGADFRWDIGVAENAVNAA